MVRAGRDRTTNLLISRRPALPPESHQPPFAFVIAYASLWEGLFNLLLQKLSVTWLHCGPNADWLTAGLVGETQTLTSTPALCVTALLRQGEAEVCRLHRNWTENPAREGGAAGRRGRACVEPLEPSFTFKFTEVMQSLISQ